MKVSKYTNRVEVSLEEFDLMKKVIVKMWDEGNNMKCGAREYSSMTEYVRCGSLAIKRYLDMKQILKD